MLPQRTEKQLNNRNMPNTGDSFVTTLKRAHLFWGSHRHTNTRGIVYGEAYLHIPISQARRLNIYNEKQPNGNIIYNCNTNDGFLTNSSLKSSGKRSENDVYAKQFHGNGNLKLLRTWFNHINAQIGDRIEVKFISPTEILLTRI